MNGASQSHIPKRLQTQQSAPLQDARQYAASPCQDGPASITDSQKKSPRHKAEGLV
ncbi:hypothetical protein XMIN_1033 [Xanthomonas citri pv. mangiferaeindicae LMG 941]|nr:hypothetical protein XMIN_1033 [Xanthomonas citri pv. mangiferaeindicae LMG 941]